MGNNKVENWYLKLQKESIPTNEWDPTAVYSVGDEVIVNGVIFKSVSNDNVGNNPYSSTKWNSIL